MPRSDAHEAAVERARVSTPRAQPPARGGAPLGPALEPNLYLEPEIVRLEQRADLRAHVAARGPRLRPGGAGQLHDDARSSTSPSSSSATRTARSARSATSAATAARACWPARASAARRSAACTTAGPTGLDGTPHRRPRGPRHPRPRQVPPRPAPGPRRGLLRADLRQPRPRRRAAGRRASAAWPSASRATTCPSLKRFGKGGDVQPANWKVVVENYIEGYHIPIAHPSLMRLLDYQRYDVEVFDDWVWFEAPMRDKPSDNRLERALPAPRASPRPASGPEDRRVWRFVLIYPNTTIDLYPDQVNTWRLWPDGADVTRDEWGTFRHPDAPALEPRRAADQQRAQHDGAEGGRRPRRQRPARHPHARLPPRPALAARGGGRVVRRPHPRRPRTGGRVSAEPDQPGEPSARERILQAACDLIAERGIGGARIAQIAKAAGVSTALVHYHFRTREVLLAETLDYAFDVAAAVRLRATGTTTSPPRTARPHAGSPTWSSSRCPRPTRAAGSGSSGPSCGSGPRATRACARSPRRCTRATAAGSRRPSRRASRRASSPASIRGTRPTWPWRSSTGWACGCSWATRRCHSNGRASGSGRSSPASFRSRPGSCRSRRARPRALMTTLGATVG